MVISTQSQFDVLSQAGLVSSLAAIIVALALLLKSMRDFSRTGPEVKEEILKHYRGYGIMALFRLVGWCAAICLFMAILGSLAYLSVCLLTQMEYSAIANFLVSLSAIAVITSLQFFNHLIRIPSSIVISSHYLMKHFYPLWKRLTPSRVDTMRYSLFLLTAVVSVLGLVQAVMSSLMVLATTIAVMLVLEYGILMWSSWRYSKHAKPAASVPDRPNIIMIGSDTLRSDRTVGNGNHRDLTPFLDKLCESGTRFSNCFVPLARTAPSLVTMHTGTWPHQHGIRDNFVGAEQSVLPFLSLPAILKKYDYSTAVISDWCGSDMGKFDFGYDYSELPEDQWNIKYLLRQGPKDLRLFLSLFTHNRFGKYFLPEIYYLAGIPLGGHIVNETKKYINKLANGRSPFLINVFMGTTHPPFGSEYPYYTLYADPDYWGESKFCMSKLTDPQEIIRSQKEPKEAFDLDQIMDLYDGAVRNFDAHVEDIYTYLESKGLSDNTIIIIYSDHGMDFFEGDTWGQGNSIYTDHSYRVPLIVYDPRNRTGNTVDSFIRSVDLAPTILDMLGLPRGENMTGESFKCYLDGNGRELDLPVYAETGIWLATPPGTDPKHKTYPELLEILEIRDKKAGTLTIKQKYVDEVIAAKDVMFRKGSWKLVRVAMEDGYQFKLFDAEADAECRVDVFEEHREIAEKLQRAMDAFLNSGEPH